ncbi:MAG: aminotransferase class III-fold pyridoxal phosphate-dependent enzyme [Pseudomonadota bacterium]
MAGAALAAVTNSKIEAAYRARTPGSARLYDRATDALPSGLTHDARALRPYPLYVASAAGARKTDVDDQTYVDYFGGHGALLLGHGHPAVIAAAEAQLRRGTHYGSSHELEVAWAELITRLVPCAQRVRFTASGTEASHLALRLARAHTGRSKVIRFQGHFHGWHDAVASGSNSHFDGGVPVGLNPALVEQTILLPADDPARVADVLNARDDVAAVMLEPSGASWGQVPLPSGFLSALRDITAAHDVVLIFDEVISGFRWSKGGAQARFGITPDLCILAKIVAGGLPGGAVAGRSDIVDQLDAKAMAAAGRDKIPHQGTYNANPVCAAAGLAALTIIDAEDACAQADATADEIRTGLRQILTDEDVPWGVYGDSSSFLIFQNPQRVPLDPATFDPMSLGFDGLKRVKNKDQAHRLRIAMLANGVDVMGAPGGLVSAVHGPEDVAETLDAFRTAVRWLKNDGDI